MGEQEQQAGWWFETRAVHVGQAADPTSGAVVVPITLSKTFAQDGVCEHKGFEYSRSGNPTRGAVMQPRGADVQLLSRVTQLCGPFIQWRGAVV